MNRNIIYVMMAAVITLAIQSCGREPSYEDDLRLLDQAIAQSQSYIDKKETGITVLRGKRSKSSSMEERYWINKDLYDAFENYNADSALFYAQQNIVIATSKKKSEDEIASWRLCQVCALISTGRLEEAGRELDIVNPDSLSAKGKVLYFGQRTLLNQTYAYYMEDPATMTKDNRSPYFNEALRYRDSTIAYSLSADPQLENMRAWQMLDRNDLDGTISLLKQKVDNSPLDNIDDAMSAYTLAQVYKYKDNQEKRIHYLICSSVAYIRSGCRNYLSESLQEISSILFDKGDINRAYYYITYCAANLFSFQNRALIVRTSKLQDRIRNEYQLKELKQLNINTLFLFVNSVLAIALLVVVVILLLQNRKLRIIRLKLTEATKTMAQYLKEKDVLNADLEQQSLELKNLNQELSETNNRLSESNTVKEEYIGYTFSLCSEYISKIEGVKQYANRMLKVGKRDKLAEFLASPTVIQDEYKSFYKGFDRIFLELYPDFVDNLNTIIQPGQEVRLKESGQLGTELRIIALMRLGISDCNKIADFLHCSVQSVYNSRRAIYAKLTISPKEFKDMIADFGKAHIANADSSESCKQDTQHTDD